MLHINLYSWFSLFSLNFYDRSNECKKNTNLLAHTHTAGLIKFLISVKIHVYWRIFFDIEMFVATSHHTLTAPHINCIKAYAPRSLCVIGNFRLNTAYLPPTTRRYFQSVARQTRYHDAHQRVRWKKKNKIQNFSYAAVCFTFWLQKCWDRR